MNIKLIVLVFFNFVFIQYCTAQKADSLIRKLDSAKKETNAIGKDTINTNPAAYNEETKITAPVYFALFLTDLTQEVTGPFHSKKRTWLKVGAFALIEGGLAFSDRPIQRFAVKLTDRSPTIKGTSSYVTRFGGLYEAYTLGALGVYGFVFKNEKMKTTTFLATQAYLTGAAMESVIKFLSGRERPNYFDSGQSGPRPTFRGPFGPLGRDVDGNKLNSSFPSGHATVAFAAATVFAQEYKKQMWVPVLAYSAATLIGLSRLTENKHWATDVFAGAALGYVTGLQVVRNYHRYAKMKNEKAHKTSFSFNPDYYQGYFLANITAHF